MDKKNQKNKDNDCMPLEEKEISYRQNLFNYIWETNSSDEEEWNFGEVRYLEISIGYTIPWQWQYVFYNNGIW